MHKLAAVISSRGIGDGIMMMVASQFLQSQGYAVTTFHNMLGQLKHWFPDHDFESLPPIEACHAVFSRFDLIVLQYDHHRLEIKLLMELYKQGKIPNLSVFYPSKESSKREVLTTWDQVFDENISMVDNVALSISSLFKLQEASKNNGLRPPFYLKPRKHKKRILIHPTRSNDAYVWPSDKFFALGKMLQKSGYEVHFVLSLQERPKWAFVEKEGFFLPALENLHELASLIYESALLIGNDSGPAHLASNMQVPTIVISNCYKRMKLWRPGWLQGAVLTPPAWILNPKGFRIREKYWDRFISPQRVFSYVQKILH
ncbi:MAG: hypothetical protein Tsb0015_00280 [Simkaniaceae bacterium]